MTDEEIDAMEAGREMDAVIAERVFGFDAACWVPMCEVVHHRIPFYSTDIAAAWLVVEKMRQERWKHFRLDYWVDSWAILQDYIPGVAAWGRSTRADTAPLAICRAALKCCKAVADKKEDATKASVNS